MNCFSPGLINRTARDINWRFVCAFRSGIGDGPGLNARHLLARRVIYSRSGRSRTHAGKCGENVRARTIADSRPAIIHFSHSFADLTIYNQEHYRNGRGIREKILIFYSLAAPVRFRSFQATRNDNRFLFISSYHMWNPWKNYDTKEKCNRIVNRTFLLITNSIKRYEICRIARLFYTLFHFINGTVKWEITTKEIDTMSERTEMVGNWNDWNVLFVFFFSRFKQPVK